jgi:hypothetical protein
MVFQGGFMSDERDKLSLNDELDNEDDDVEAHVLGDEDRGVLGDDAAVLGDEAAGQRDKLS